MRTYIPRVLFLLEREMNTHHDHTRIVWADALDTSASDNEVRAVVIPPIPSEVDTCAAAVHNQSHA